MIVDKYTVLNEYFGYDTFRRGQEELIDSIIQGKDTLGIMPTGAGKSLCFQVPALVMNGITLVISPLISLMKDQVSALIQAGIPAAFLNSSLNYRQYVKALRYAKQNKYKIIYVAPERLLTEEFQSFARESQIDLISVDEAHCVSQWGQDFRPSYLKIRKFIETLPKRPAIAAFTATATKQVGQDIIKILNLEDPTVLTTGFDRKNLSFEVRKPRDKYREILRILKDHTEESGIIYCSTRKNVEEICFNLEKDGFKSTRYHAGLTDTERKGNQEDFVYDKKTIMVATNAFGMGIDKSNVSYVIHYNMPKNVEAYYQEAGRAGRDGENARCILLYSGQDVVTNQFLIDNGYSNEELDEETSKLVKAKDRERLKVMTFYCHTKDCLREYILKYFGETSPNYCGNCSNCLENFQTMDISAAAKAVLSFVRSTNSRFGVKVIVDTLRGSRAQRIIDLRLNANSQYNICSDISEQKLRSIINFMILEGYIHQTNDQYPIIEIIPKGEAFLEGRAALKMKVAKEEEREEVKTYFKEKSRNVSLDPGDKELFEALRALRGSLANKQGVPAYIIFSDASLISMCKIKPTNKTSFLMVSGVGQVKLNQYGEEFLEVIRENM